MTSRIIPVIIILIALGLFFGYINPVYTGRIAELKSEIESYDAALAAAKRFTEKESALLIERESLNEGDLERLQAFLPDGVNNVELILDLNALADRSGLQLSNFDVTRESDSERTRDGLSLTSEGPVDSLDLSVSAVGTYASFKAFSQALEWSLRPMDLVEVSIQDSPSGVYRYTMTYRIYWLR